MSQLKAFVNRVLAAPGIADAAHLAIANRGVIFMLHRFSTPDLGSIGHDPEFVKRVLAYLRRRKYILLSLEEVFRRLAGDEPLTRTVSFTIDDGYLDHALIGAPIFAEFDCPVTTFVTTGFLDGTLWFWWDRVEYVFRKTQVPAVTLTLNDLDVHYNLDSDDAKQRAQTDFVARCNDINVSEREKIAAIDRLAHVAEIDIPAVPPREYAPMSWDQLRRCESMGMTFGPHTVTHPILSHTSDEQSHAEICDSWERLRTMANAAVPIFCYPNGRLSDFGEREMRTLESIGLKGAVSGRSGYADAKSFHASPLARFRVPRLGFTESDEMDMVVQAVTGVERLKQLIRRDA
jgi:peptidoglycan/xylan/chitin deacetylase (PgdA/CDA1 family)